MGAIVLIDTSVYLNVLDIAGWNQDRAQILDAFAQRIEAQDSLLLPMATIWETGNHIADLADGVSLADLSMIKEWERTRERHPLSDVILWSLDSDLRSYQHRGKT